MKPCTKLNTSIGVVEGIQMNAGYEVQSLSLIFAIWRDVATKSPVRKPSPR